MSLDVRGNPTGPRDACCTRNKPSGTTSIRIDVQYLRAASGVARGHCSHRAEPERMMCRTDGLRSRQCEPSRIL